MRSKDTEAGGGIKSAIKRANSNQGGPGSSSGSKTHEEVGFGTSEKKKKTLQEAWKEKTVKADMEPIAAQAGKIKT